MKDLITQQSELIDKLSQQLSDIINCPANIVEATCPKGIQHYPPTQVILEYSICYARVLQAQELLKDVTALKITELTSSANPTDFLLILGSTANDLKTEAFSTQEEYQKRYDEEYGFHSIQEGYYNGEKLNP